MWNKTTYPFLVQALCIIPLKSIRMWASFAIFEFEGKDEAQDKLIMFLNTNGVSQAKIVQKLNISARLVRNVLSKK